MCATTTAGTPPLTIFHKQFLQNDKPFQFRGLVYQLHWPRHDSAKPRPPKSRDLPPHIRYADRDALNDDRYDAFARDVALFEELHVNALWIYQVNPFLSHKQCMALLAAKGIYVFIGMSSPSECINRMAPMESYNEDLLRRYYSVVEAFRKFDNVAGFVVADQVVNNVETTVAARVVRAVVRDVKRYVTVSANQDGGRIVPVGVADAEWAATQSQSATYYTAHGDGADIDFYAFVNFGCWPSIKDGAQRWRELGRRLGQLELPVLISEYGANAVRPRQFEETRLLFEEPLQGLVCGGFAYEFVEGSNRYGLVRIHESNVEKLGDFKALSKQLDEAASQRSFAKIPENIEHGSEAEEVGLPPMTASWLADGVLPDSPLSPEEYEGNGPQTEDTR